MTIVPFVDVLEEVGHSEELDVPHTQESNEDEHQPQTYPQPYGEEHHDVHHDYSNDVDQNAVELYLEHVHLPVLILQHAHNPMQQQTHVEDY